MNVWVLIPLAGLAIPIVAIFASHQQKMAELINRNTPAEYDAQRMATLEGEVVQMRQALNSLTLTVEGLRDDVKFREELSSRVEVNN